MSTISGPELKLIYTHIIVATGGALAASGEGSVFLSFH